MDQEKIYQTYDRYYYERYLPGAPYERNEHWLAFFGVIADHIVQDIKPTTVLDAGCAMGFLVECLRHRGVHAYGVDISNYAIENTHPDIQPYCWTGSITLPFPKKYDLIVSLEVVEHLLPAEAERHDLPGSRQEDDSEVLLLPESSQRQNRLEGRHSRRQVGYELGCSVPRSQQTSGFGGA